MQEIVGGVGGGNQYEGGVAEYFRVGETVVTGGEVPRQGEGAGFQQKGVEGFDDIAMAMMSTVGFGQPSFLNFHHR